ncbi:hypothetical protein [Aminobacter sp. MDW-2]|uniref:hypothetical protein n=1 Tax=Aminobacter sp. MDW-2 TaxID=2666139 RepID=UPI0012B159F2|nr:hypothetical protein [Aminobacter sp. MDW-2]MRX37592.1 hypothetical protein [Aminobacter sp. MDW-2]QNH33828.1 hypothetical protein H5P29_25615 [Aminobacter sp. MDW-2]
MLSPLTISVRFFYNGIDLARDYEEAARWFSKAAAQGDADAQARLNSMRELIRRRIRCSFCCVFSIRADPAALGPMN